MGATLWDKSPGGSLPSSSSVDASDSLDPNSSGLREICTLGDISGDAVSHVSWMPGERSDKVMVLAGNRLNLCDLGAEVGEDNKAKIVSTGK